MNMTLKVLPEEMTQAINQFESVRGEAEAAVTAINNIIDELDSAWAGADAEGFRAKMGTMRTAMSSMQNRLQGYVNGLNDALQQYQNTEGDIASSQVYILEESIIR